MALGLALLLAGAAARAQAPAAAAASLPDTPGVEVLRARCLSCHEADLITGQRLTEAGWGREIDKMVRWGARVPDADRPALVAYLARHFAPRGPGADRDVAAGEAVYQRACLSCHGSDLIESQRLTEAGWTREVEKMMRWGAQVGDADKAMLVAYLAAKHPAR